MWLSVLGFMLSYISDFYGKLAGAVESTLDPGKAMW